MANKDFYYIQETVEGNKVIKKVSLSSTGAIFTIDENGEIDPVNDIDASIQIKRGSYEEISSEVLAEGELAYATDVQIVYVGDGQTPGGARISGGDQAFIYDEGTITPSLGDNNQDPARQSTLSSILSGCNNCILDSTSSSISASSNSTIVGDTSSIMGGCNHAITGQSNIIIGGEGSNITGNLNVVAGGCINNITLGADFSSIISGENNSIISDRSSVVGGLGHSIRSLGTKSVILGGEYNIIDNSNSAIVAGDNHCIVAPFSSIVGGRSGCASVYGEQVHAVGSIFEPGDAQKRTVIMTSKGSAIFEIDNSGESSTPRDQTYKSPYNVLRIPNNVSWYVECKIVGRDADSGNTYNFQRECVLYSNDLGSVLVEGPGGNIGLPVGDASPVLIIDEVTRDINSVPETFEVLTIDPNTSNENIYWIAEFNILQIINAPTGGSCCCIVL